jgi:hypothetical protein
VTSVGTGAAQIAATINPRGTSTTYYVEYGTEPCATSTCAQQPVAPGEPLGDEGSSPVLREIELGGLAPGTTYHYRVIAEGAEAVAESEEGTFTTRRTGATGPLDGRAYEMVSPLQKNSADIAPTGGLNNFLMQAAEDGNGLVYPSSTPFADPKAAPPSSAYRGVRGAGGEWSTQNISPLGGALEQQVKGLTADLSQAVIVSSEPPLCCGAVNGIKNLYLRDNETGAYTLITTEEPRLAIAKTSYCPRLEGFTANFGHVFFKANGALTPDAPEGPGFSLYEWSAGKGIELVSVLPDSNPATPAGGTSFGVGGTECEFPGIAAGAVSEDGSHLVWTYGGTAPSELLDRIAGTETVQLDLTQGGSGPAGGGRYWAASEDGTKVFFTDPNPLTPGAHSEDLYRYDFAQPLGSRLTDVSAGAGAANVKGVVASSQAGDAIYFVAQGVLAANSGPAIDPETGTPEKAVVGANNLYLWREGQPLRFIARMAPSLNVDPTSDASAWDISPASRNAAVSADGQVLAFLSIEPLSGYENISQADGKAVKEVYLYDAESNQLTCPSCNPTGVRPFGPADLAGWKTPFFQPRFLSGGGARLFFESFDALAEGDLNGARDVYEFERAGSGDCEEASPSYYAVSGGCLALVSGGATGVGNSFFLDASSSGDDVFISTAQPLAATDGDEKFDAYDARVDGIPALPPPPPAEECPTAAKPCQPPPPPPPPVTGPGAANGEGNPPQPKPCPKGKVRRNGKCVKKHGHRKHHHKKHRRTAK